MFLNVIIFSFIICFVSLWICCQPTLFNHSAHSAEMETEHSRWAMLFSIEAPGKSLSETFTSFWDTPVKTFLKYAYFWLLIFVYLLIFLSYLSHLSPFVLKMCFQSFRILFFIVQFRNLSAIFCIVCYKAFHLYINKCITWMLKNEADHTAPRHQFCTGSE